MSYETLDGTSSCIVALQSFPLFLLAKFSARFPLISGHGYKFCACTRLQPLPNCFHTYEFKGWSHIPTVLTPAAGIKI